MLLQNGCERVLRCYTITFNFLTGNVFELECGQYQANVMFASVSHRAQFCLVL